MTTGFSLYGWLIGLGQGVLRFLGFEIYRARLMRKYGASTAADLVQKLLAA